VVSKGESLTFEPGRVVFDEGEFNPYLYLLISGHIDLSMKVTGRGAVRILTLGGGDLVAWSSVLGSGVMTCRATCTTSCAVMRWHHEHLETICRHHPNFGYRWMSFIAKTLAQRLTATRMQLLDLFACPSGGRG
jgi:CRP-like cAMP-binding protein